MSNGSSQDPADTFTASIYAAKEVKRNAERRPQQLRVKEERFAKSPLMNFSPAAHAVPRASVSI